MTQLDLARAINPSVYVERIVYIGLSQLVHDPAVTD